MPGGAPASSIEMYIHKEGHGVLVRRMAFAVLAGMTVWGGMTLYAWLVGFWDGLKNLRLFDYRIPVLDQYIDPAFLISWGLVAVGVWALLRYLNREKAAEYLIEADAEFKRVTWPTWGDAFNSALVVLVFVATMTAYIALCDGLLSGLWRHVL